MAQAMPWVCSAPRARDFQDGHVKLSLEGSDDIRIEIPKSIREYSSTTFLRQLSKRAHPAISWRDADNGRTQDRDLYAAISWHPDTVEPVDLKLAEGDVHVLLEQAGGWKCPCAAGVPALRSSAGAPVAAFETPANSRPSCMPSRLAPIVRALRVDGETAARAEPGSRFTALFERIANRGPPDKVLAQIAYLVGSSGNPWVS